MVGGVSNFAEKGIVSIFSEKSKCRLVVTVKPRAPSCAGGCHNIPRLLQVDLWSFDLESGVRVTCDVGYLCANFSLTRPLCSRLKPAVRDRQTKDRQTEVRRASSLNAPYPTGGCI